MRQHLIRLLDLAEKRSWAVEVGVDPLNQLAVLRFNLGWWCRGRHAQDVVIGVASHASTMPLVVV